MRVSIGLVGRRKSRWLVRGPWGALPLSRATSLHLHQFLLSAEWLMTGPPTLFISSTLICLKQKNRPYGSAWAHFRLQVLWSQLGALMESCLTEIHLHPYKTLHLVPEPCLLACNAVWNNIFITDFWFHDVMRSNANIERQQPHLQSPVIFFNSFKKPDLCSKCFTLWGDIEVGMPEIRVACLLNFPIPWLCVAGPPELSALPRRHTLKGPREATALPLTHTSCVGSTQEPCWDLIIHIWQTINTKSYSTKEVFR